MARKGTLRVVLAVLLGLLAALCLLSLASAQLVETECTPLKPKACKKSPNCFSTGKKKNHRCTAAGPLGAERCIAVQKAKGKPNMRTRCGEQTAPGGRCECAKPKKKCGACTYRPDPNIPVTPVTPVTPTSSPPPVTPTSPPPPVAPTSPPPPPTFLPVPPTPVGGDAPADGD